MMQTRHVPGGALLLLTAVATAGLRAQTPTAPSAPAAANAQAQQGQAGQNAAAPGAAQTGTTQPGTNAPGAGAPAATPSATTQMQASPAPGAAGNTGMGGLNLTAAIGLAQSNVLLYATAVANQKVAAEQVKIARSALLPNVVYHNQFLYTQPQHSNGENAGTGTPRFIANNATHEYISLGSVTETLSGALLTDYRGSQALAASAKATAEVARRGLVTTVITNYYAVMVADEKMHYAQTSLDQAQHYLTLSSQLEAGGEVAHSDVVKSRLQVEQRQRDLSDAKLATQRTRIDLGVLLYANPSNPYSLTGDLTQPPVLPARDEVGAAANKNNPDLQAALATFKAAGLEVRSSKFGYLPALSLNYSYGIDAAHFAVTDPQNIRNLGYSVSATLDIPVWDWFATRARIHQSEARKDLAQTDLNLTQRQLAASIEQLYLEAQTALSQIGSLDQSVNDARQALSLVELRYKNGESPILELVDAQTTLVTAQNARADGAARYYTALANLQTLTGNLP